ncbi:hypothetical protein [Thiothrix subterranea]|uniref:Uncharacterized protein n=2 Tax=Thiothrix subterranea TaxID=2735563 RepID=A0AA51MQH6_9GAMM|nr:hypothetical protein [Thiothrix subterranea]MDQ5766923.1 hypothetical protein [Thiothrix subterranea]WML88215.1 hypothetical protein RCG00_07520 [Thiothrix subterranea]
MAGQAEPVFLRCLSSPLQPLTMASKPKRVVITKTQKKPVTPPKTTKPRRKRQTRRAWWDVLLDYLGNFILLLLVSALILGVAHLFLDFAQYTKAITN